jgi:phage terminase large subunit-like protein
MFTPTICTAPLSEDFKSAIDGFLPALQYSWKVANGAGWEIEPWQVELLRRVFEVYPEGHPKAGVLRYRQCVISVARQNGKTELAALASVFWLLLKEQNEYMAGIASNAQQARLIYDRVQRVISANPALSKRMNKLTDTRGIQTKKGTTYVILANKESAAQGYPVSLGLLDELHTYQNSSVYAAVLASTGARDNCIVLGITTAGDESSALLKDLYEQGKEAAADPSTRFGFFVWEAAEARIPDDDAELLELLRQANPSMQSGRIDEQNLLSDVRSMPVSDAIRYRLNRFVEASSVFVEQAKWSLCTRNVGDEFPHVKGRTVFAIDRSPDWGYASIVAAVRDGETTHVELVASLKKPNLEMLVEYAQKLMRHNPATFIVEGYSMRDFAGELKRRGIPVVIAAHSDLINGSSLFFSKIMHRTLRHGAEPLLTVQLRHTRIKNVGEGWKVARKDSSVEIDAVISCVLAVQQAEQTNNTKLQIY